ncbi:MAG: hypothetical protein AMXMBFR58_06120 [Phycisphaerae bacterium]
MTTEPAVIDKVLDQVAEAVNASGTWKVVKRTTTLVQAVAGPITARMPCIGAVEYGKNWLTLDFWIQSPDGGLGVFWRSNRVTDIAARNHVLAAILADSRTGFLYKGRADWWHVPEPAFCGRTVSSTWWPKGSSPSLTGAAAEVGRCLTEWSARIPAIVEAIKTAPPGSASVAAVVVPSSNGHVRAKSPPRATDGSRHTTPLIPSEFRRFRAQPEYTSIFEIYPDETRIYGTEDLYGDWDAEVILMAKDAGNSRNFKPREQGGLGWAWVHNPSRSTNRNLIPLAEQLPGGKLYASFLGPLLRNDGGESGPLFMDGRVRAFVRSLFEWTIASMPRVQTVAVLGQEAWREVVTAAGKEPESREWKPRHLSGDPLSVSVAGKEIRLVALNHPARIPAYTLMQQPGWRWILSQHADR